MPQPSTVANPFMLMIQPEAVFAAVERSERLGALNRQLCRPLDTRQPRGAEGVEDDDAPGGAEAGALSDDASPRAPRA